MTLAQPAREMIATPFVTLLAEKNAIVAGRFKFQQRKFVIRTLGFLNAKNVRGLFLEPANDQRQASNDRINVPGSYFHVSCQL
jgi:hypothetical protein